MQTDENEELTELRARIKKLEADRGKVGTKRAKPAAGCLAIVIVGVCLVAVSVWVGGLSAPSQVSSGVASPAADLTEAPATGYVVNQSFSADDKVNFMFACAQALATINQKEVATASAHLHLPWRIERVRNGKHPRLKCEVYDTSLGDGYVVADMLCKQPGKKRCARPISLVLGGTERYKH